MLSVAIIGTQGLPAKYGGFETLADQIVRLLGMRFDFTVYCSGVSYPKRPHKYRNAKLKYLPFKANGLQSIIYDCCALFDAILNCDVLLVLGVSGCVFLSILRIISHKKFIVNVDGIEWKRDKWGFFAKCFLRFSELVAVRSAHEIIADNLGIANYLFLEYQIRAVTIEYGGNQVLSSRMRKKNENENSSYCFAVCRIEPENNIHVMLKAFTDSNHKIVIVGNWNDSKYGRKLRNIYRLHCNITMCDPIYDLQKLNDLRCGCMLYLHGHSAGGTNPSLVEAMWLGLPIVAYDVKYNRFTTENKAYYFSNEAQLKELIQLLYLAPEKRNSIGSMMKETAEKKYRWDFIVEQYAKILKSTQKIIS